MHVAAQVGIIGAGITGLAAAYHLRKAGISVAVYDASVRPGGVICSHREGPWLAEGGPNTILETDPRLPRFVEELGLDSRRQYSDPDANARYVVRSGRPVRLPGFGPEFFASPLFSARAKLRLLREPFIGRDTEDSSVASFVRRRLGQEFLDYAIDPMVTGIYAGDPDALSIRHAFPRIHALEARYGSLILGQIIGGRERKRRGDISKAKKFSFDDGLQVLPDAIHWLLGDTVQPGTLVEEVIEQSGGWRLLGRRLGTLIEAQHRAVLFCGTAHSLGRLKVTAPHVPSLVPMTEVHCPPVTSVVLGFRRADVAHPCRGFGMLIPHCEGFGILGTIFSSALFPGRAPAGHLTLTTYVGGARNPDAAQLSEDRIMELVMNDLRRLLGVGRAPVFQHLTRWKHAIPQYNVGYERHKQLMADLEARASGLFVAGHFRDGVALSDSILTGIRAAERIANHLETQPASTQATLTAAIG